MINLRTGVPGSGKTLSAVEALAGMLARFEKHPEEARPIFVHGVKELALPHAKLPLHEVTIGKGTRATVPDWAAVPDGAYVLVDEAQEFFPPRATGAAAPEHVAWLNTHRHRGIDLTVITQHPRLIDSALRALVGKHQHYRRLFGRARAVVYEWDACSDSLGGLKNAITSHFSFPRKAYQWYKSAEVHTKQNFKLPKWLLLPVVGLVLGIVAAPLAYTRIMSMSDTSQAKLNIVAAGSAKGVQGIAPMPGAASSSAGPAALPASAAVVPPPVVYAGCIAMAKKCQCIDTGGRFVEVTFQRCEANVAQSGADIPYDVKPTQVASVVPVEATASRGSEAPGIVGFNAGDFRNRQARGPVNDLSH